MSSPPPPPRGSMILYDRMDPLLPPGDYRLRVSTELSLAGASLDSVTRHFRVEAPRLSLSPGEVSGVYPPRNGRGPFDEALPHVTLGRRTLPWERTVDESVTPRPPWLALLLFEEGPDKEITIERNVPYQDIVGAARAGADGAVLCEAISVDRTLLRSVLPTRDELALLTHVRQVNTEDRELAANDSDGWFSVVVANRLPQNGRKYRACLVSLEGRTDLVSNEVPPVDEALLAPPPDLEFELAPGVIGLAGLGTDVIREVAGHRAAFLEPSVERIRAGARGSAGVKVVPPPPERLVLLYSWAFECEGNGSFERLAATLDVGLIGEVRGQWPFVAETGHMPMELRDRAGALQSVWYRGPLVPAPVSRGETAAPAPGADDLRTVVFEAGMEDISLSAAFEVGRLMAASDGRLAQDILRWRRGDFETRFRDLRNDRMAGMFSEIDFRRGLVITAQDLLDRWRDPLIDPADLFGLEVVRERFDTAALADAWGLNAAAVGEMLAAHDVATAPPIDRTVPSGAVHGGVESFLDQVDAAGLLGDRQAMVGADLRNAASFGQNLNRRPQ